MDQARRGVQVKITDSDIIRNSERELMDSITAELDWGAIEQVFKDKHDLSLHDDIETQKGDLVVHDGQIAYRLDFDVRVTLTVLFDREGNYLSLKAARQHDEPLDPVSGEEPGATESEDPVDQEDSAEESLAEESLVAASDEI
jgi:hypothetical protein